MISRVAESCFWLNRYVERVEALARLLNVNVAFQLDVDLPRAERWRPLVVVIGQEQDFVERTPPEQRDDAEVVQEYLVWSEDNQASIVSSLRWARENARTIRETVSLEMWETLNGLSLWLHDRAARRLYQADRHAFYARVRDTCQLFHGVCHGTMLHEDPFEFMRLGTALERVNQTARVLDVKYHSIGHEETGLEMPADAAQWLAMLRFCAGVEPFFKRRENTLSGRDVARFLLFDRTFPRSVHHNLLRARNFLALVRPEPPTPVGERSWKLLGETLERFEALGVDEVMQRGLHEVLTGLVETTARICEEVHSDFFDPVVTPGRGAAG